jgi:hypothetical protein
VFLVYPQNGLNGLILNWCTSVCWFTPAFILNWCTGGCWFTSTHVYLWFNGVLFHLCIILTHDFFDMVAGAAFPHGVSLHEVEGISVGVDSP